MPLATGRRAARYGRRVSAPRGQALRDRSAAGTGASRMPQSAWPRRGIACRDRATSPARRPRAAVNAFCRTIVTTLAQLGLGDVWPGQCSSAVCGPQVPGQRRCESLGGSGQALAASDVELEGLRQPRGRNGAQPHGELCFECSGVARCGGDPHAARVLDGFMEAFGLATANLITIFDPDIIVLGGGLSNMDEIYAEGTRRVLDNIMGDQVRTRISRNTSGDSAGVFGAALHGYEVRCSC